jgi:hypothetical protein
MKRQKISDRVIDRDVEGEIANIYGANAGPCVVVRCDDDPDFGRALAFDDPHCQDFSPVDLDPSGKKCQRADFQHKLSRRLVDKNQAICVGTLRIKNMQQKSLPGQGDRQCRMEELADQERLARSWEACASRTTCPLLPSKQKAGRREPSEAPAFMRGEPSHLNF